MKIDKYIKEMFTVATGNLSSDIYFLCQNRKYQIVMRTNKGITEYDTISMNLASQIINSLKYSAEMAVSEKRRPQTGKVFWRDYPLRLSTVGDVNGNESLVIRIIYDNEPSKIKFFNGCEYSNIRKLCRKRGMVVFAGPTGSGKTSTIYKLASELSEDQIIMTIEDPIEISSESFLQLQINEAAGLNYAELIKVGLRHRPDAFIIGEIRDSKTANAAIQAALSGHLVLTTIHAQSPSGVIKRLKNLGIDNEYIDQALTGVAYQRLVTTKNDDQQALLVSHPASELNQGEYDWSRWQLYLKGGVDDGEIDSSEASRYQFG